MMNVDLSIEQKLFEELRVRNSRLLIPHLILIFFSYLVFQTMHSEVPGAYWPYLLTLSSLAVRFFIMKLYHNRIHAYLFFVGTTGLSWGLLYWQVYAYFGLFSVESLYCLGVILSLMAGGVTAFAASIKTTSIYLLCLGCIPFYLLVKDPTPSSYILGILLLGNTLYQLYHAFVSNNFHREALRNELVALTQKESLQQYIDAIPGLVALINEDETYVMVNNYLDGYFREHLLGNKIGSVYPETDVPKIIKKFIASNEETAVQEIKFSGLGSEEWYMVNLKRITNPSQGTMVTILPITELVKAKNDLKIQEARSQYAAKLASLGELSASIAHEVNNPLTIIEGAANLMKILLSEKPLDMTTMEKTTSKVMETTQRIARIIKSLRMLSGDGDEEPFKSISFSAIVEPSLEISKAKIKDYQIKLSVIAEEKEVALFGNEIQLSQVIMNLVSNAIDAVKDNEGDKWIEIHFKPTLEWLDILVVDNGNGVSSDIRDKIMDPFFTTKGSEHGTGLGLSISHSIINNHQGLLELLDVTGHTTFRIRLPRMSLWVTKKKAPEKDTNVVQRSKS